MSISQKSAQPGSMVVPGLTETFGDPVDCKPFGPPISKLKPVGERGVILLSTATITEDNIFMNGLFQNIFIFYRMFEAMGYAPIFIMNDKPKDLKKIPDALRKCRMIVAEDLLRQPIPNLVAMLEIGMSLDTLFRQYVKMLGGRLIKVYLGNILNIDTETPIYTPSHNFSHHIVGRNDMILVSPHYGQHAEYAACLNHVVPPSDLKKMIAPYVWDPVVLTRDGTQHLAWRPAANAEEEVFIIMEPNISFQKSSIVPLMIAERWYRAQGGSGGSWKGKVVVINGERLQMVPHYRHNVGAYLDLQKDGRIEYEDRTDIVSALKKWPAATFILHNFNNEYNYMTMELLWTGFPVIHNSPTWAAYGYSYDAADIEAGASLIGEIRKRHGERLETYKAHAHCLAWRHSPYNPENHAAWEALLTK